MMRAKKTLRSQDIEKLENTTAAVGHIGVIIEIVCAAATCPTCGPDKCSSPPPPERVCCDSGGCAMTCNDTCDCGEDGTAEACCISAGCGDSCTNTCY